MGIRNLGSLEVFVALADTQSFTEAAKRLGMTTSAAAQGLGRRVSGFVDQPKKPPGNAYGSGAEFARRCESTAAGCSRVGNGGYGIFANPPAFAAGAG